MPKKKEKKNIKKKVKHDAGKKAKSAEYTISQHRKMASKILQDVNSIAEDKYNETNKADHKFINILKTKFHAYEILIFLNMSYFFNSDNIISSCRKICTKNTVLKHKTSYFKKVLENFIPSLTFGNMIDKYHTIIEKEYKKSDDKKPDLSLNDIYIIFNYLFSLDMSTSSFKLSDYHIRKFIIFHHEDVFDLNKFCNHEYLKFLENSMHFLEKHQHKDSWALKFIVLNEILNIGRFLSKKTLTENNTLDFYLQFKTILLFNTFIFKDIYNNFNIDSMKNILELGDLYLFTSLLFDNKKNYNSKTVNEFSTIQDVIDMNHEIKLMNYISNIAVNSLNKTRDYFLKLNKTKFNNAMISYPNFPEFSLIEEDQDSNTIDENKRVIYSISEEEVTFNIKLEKGKSLFIKMEDKTLNIEIDKEIDLIKIDGEIFDFEKETNYIEEELSYVIEKGGHHVSIDVDGNITVRAINKKDYISEIDEDSTSEIDEDSVEINDLPSMFENSEMNKIYQSIFKNLLIKANDPNIDPRIKYLLNEENIKELNFLDKDYDDIMELSQKLVLPDLIGDLLQDDNTNTGKNKKKKKKKKEKNIEEETQTTEEQERKQAEKEEQKRKEQEERERKEQEKREAEEAEQKRKEEEKKEAEEAEQKRKEERRQEHIKKKQEKKKIKAEEKRVAEEAEQKRKSEEEQKRKEQEERERKEQEKRKKQEEENRKRQEEREKKEKEAKEKRRQEHIKKKQEKKKIKAEEKRKAEEEQKRKEQEERERKEQEERERKEQEKREAEEAEQKRKAEEEQKRKEDAKKKEEENPISNIDTIKKPVLLNEYKNKDIIKQQQAKKNINLIITELKLFQNLATEYQKIYQTMNSFYQQLVTHETELKADINNFGKIILIEDNYHIKKAYSVICEIKKELISKNETIEKLFSELSITNIHEFQSDINTITKLKEELPIKDLEETIKQYNDAHNNYLDYKALYLNHKSPFKSVYNSNKNITENISFKRDNMNKFLESSIKQLNDIDNSNNSNNNPTRTHRYSNSHRYSNLRRQSNIEINK